ncbi:MBL fold metallo-hydrolase [Actinopolymorpha pittospori]|uniref:Ribonuclease BN (tRNA processing enzyme) n=1 Tax=Actinopolymorpha pittospori TaxID=648752 RepID=A0A927MW39_9ACTN|nr:ribonuclease BN (tRNA processing enzyme) [Actinopolymorpha pittospori]
MRLTILGCAGSFPGPESPASGYLVETPYDGRIFRLVLDLGNGAFGALQRYVDPDEVDAVGLSHLHADHCLDLCSYYVARKYHPDGPREPIPVYGPARTGDRLATAYGLPGDPGMREEFEFRVWKAAAPLRIGPFTVTVLPVAHPVEAYAVRVEHAGRSLVYSGDTGPTEALADLARGTDLFLCEATFLHGEPNPPDLHLTGREAGEYAKRAGVGRLVLTHVPAWYDGQRMVDDARAVYTGRLDLARAGDVYDV